MTDQLRIKFVAAEDTNRGKYHQLEVTYKNQTFGDKTETFKHMSFVNKDVYDTLKNAKAGDEFVISRTKDGQYWKWTGIAASAGAAPTGAQKPSGTTPAPRSTYETPEERAKKQVYIVRQSSVANAIDLLKTEKKQPTVEEVVATAKQFEAYVFGTGSLGSGEALPPAPEDLGDDIPY